MNDVFKPMNYSDYSKQLQKLESRAVKAFIDIKGIPILLKLLSHNKEISIKVTRMILNLTLELLSIHQIIETLLKQSLILSEFIQTLINDPIRNYILASIIRKILSIIKYNSKPITINIANAGNYFPIYLIESIKGIKEPNASFVFIELLHEFLLYESEAPPITFHQEILYKKLDFYQIFHMIEKYKKTPIIGKITELMLRSLGRLKNKNSQVTIELCKSDIISENILLHFITEGISEV